jgi:hypothetical protein
MLRLDSEWVTAGSVFAVYIMKIYEKSIAFSVVFIVFYSGVIVRLLISNRLAALYQETLSS